MTLQLSGMVPDHDDRDARISDLERVNRQLSRDLATARADVQRVQDETAQSLGNLRRQLGPLYRALQMVFGELDAAGVASDAGSSSNSAPDKRVSAIWESWKERMGGGCAKIIDALLLQKDMNTQQLAIAIGVHRNSIPQMIWKLNKAGLIEKNGGRFSLKALS